MPASILVARVRTYNDLLLSGRLWAYLADLNEQAQARLEVIIDQMKDTEGVTEDLKHYDYWKRPLVSVSASAPVGAKRLPLAGRTGGKSGAI